MSSTTEVRVPDIGDFTDVPVIEIHVSPGDEVALEDPLVTLESDKATMDVPAPIAGVIKQLSVKIGDRVSEGSVLLSVETEAADGAGARDGATAPAGATHTRAGATHPPAPRTPAPAPPRSHPPMMHRNPVLRWRGRMQASTMHRSW